MKSTQSTQATPSTGAGTTAAPAPVADSAAAFVELTADAVADDMIRAVLADARESGNTDVSVMCSKALRRLATISKDADAAARRAARAECARTINDRAASWITHSTTEDRLYASLVGAAPSARPEDRPPGTPTVDVRRHPLCWECNDSIDPDQEHRIVKLRNGQVSVHLQCVNFIDDAELGDEASDVLAEAEALGPEPPTDVYYYPDGGDTIDCSEDER